MARRADWVLLAALLLGSPASGQDPSGLARLDLGASHVADEGPDLAVTLALSQTVPWRLYTLDAPPRLVVDFRTVDWGMGQDGLLVPGLATGLRAGAIRSGWSRLVVDLAEPLLVSEAGMVVDGADGSALLKILLQPTDPETFAASSGAPASVGWDLPDAVEATLTIHPGAFVVAIDPGHGGIDPGAERGGLREAHLMLAMAREVSEAVARAGMVPVLTRDSDVFVPLAQRMTTARAAGADVLISLHADALEADAASGASIYTLSQQGVDQASRRMVERHERGDLLAGVDLSDQDDPVATALMDLARLDTAPRSARLAATLAEELSLAGARVNSHALRQAPLAVLNAADFPSVLIEVGFLSDESDRVRLSSPAGRAPVVAGIVAALSRWSTEEEALSALRLR